MLLPEAEARTLLAELPRVGAFEDYRVAIGLPLWGSELDEETTPLEGGLDRQISFSKGCYVGQEVVAMATFRGRASRGTWCGSRSRATRRLRGCASTRRARAPRASAAA